MADPINSRGAETPTNAADQAASGEASAGATTGGAAATAPTDPRAGGPGNLPSAPASAPAGMTSRTDRAAPADGDGPFEGEAEVMNEGVAIRDDISKTQSAATYTRDVSSSHVARLLYRPIEAPGGPVYQAQVLEQRNRRQG